MDRKQRARNTFDRIMRVPDTIIATMTATLLGLPLLMSFDLLTTNRPNWHTETVFLSWLMAALFVAVPAYFVLRIIAAAAIAAITARRAAGCQAVQGHSEQIPHSASSAQL